MLRTESIGCFATGLMNGRSTGWPSCPQLPASEWRLGAFHHGSVEGDLVRLLILSLGQIGERFKVIKKFGMHHIWRKEKREYSTPQAEGSNGWRVVRHGHEWEKMVRVMRHEDLQREEWLLCLFVGGYLC